MPRHRTHRRFPALHRVGLVAGIIALTLATPGTAVAGPTAATGHHRAHLSVRPHTVRPGGHIVIAGRIPTIGAQSCPATDQAIPTSTAELFPPDGFGPAAQRSSSGRFTIRYTVPTSTPPGTYRIGVRCGGGNVGVSATLRVT